MKTTRDKLREAGEHHAATVAQERAAAKQRDVLIRQALAEGIPKKEIADLARVTRATVYKHVS